MFTKLQESLWGTLGYGDQAASGSEPTTTTTTTTTALRVVSDNRVFERIIEAINGNSYVYSNNVIKSYSGRDGTLAWEYIETLDPASINFEGPITAEQTASAGLQYAEGSADKATLLTYLVNYCHNNKGKFAPDKLAVMVETLVKKGAEFDFNIYEKCKALGVDISKLWSAGKGINLSSCSAEELFSALGFNVLGASEMTRPVLHSFFCNKPIQDIFPSIMGDIRFDNYIELFDLAMKERLALVQTNLDANMHEASKELRPDFTVSTLVREIVSEANIDASIENLSAEILKLTHAKEAARIRITADALLKSELELVKLIDQQHAKTSEIKRMESMVSTTNAEISRDEQKIERDKKELSAKMRSFKDKWEGDKEQNMTQELTMAKAGEAQAIASSKQLNAMFCSQLEKKRESLKSSEATLEVEKENLKALNIQVTVAEVCAINTAQVYNAYVKVQQETNADINTHSIFGLPQCTKDMYESLGKAEGIRRLFSESCVYDKQKEILFFSLVKEQQWNCIHPLFQNGILLEGVVSGKTNDTALKALASHYNAEASQEIILMLVHTSPEAMKGIMNPEQKIRDVATQFFTNTPTYLHLVNKQEELQQPSNSK